MKRAIIESVEDFDKTSDANIPKLVTFASGDKVPDGAKFANFRNKEDGSLLLTAQTERLHYVNKSHPEKLMLAVVNKTTGKARLVPLHSYHLSPALESGAAPEPGPESGPAARPTWVDVGKAFGLARWQNAHQRINRLTVGSGARSVAEVLTAAAQHVRPETETAAEGEQEAGLVPPRDPEASSPDGVYSREAVVPGWLCGKLRNSADQFETALTTHASTSEYFVVQATKWRDSDEDRFALTMYGFYMIRLLRYLQDMCVIKSWKKLMVPAPVLEHLRDTFMERSHNGWDRSERLLDKLVCHFMVVALWIHDYSINLEDIAGATRIKIKKLSQYASLLGLTVSTNRAILKLPLKLKPATNSRRTKKVAAM